MFHTLLESVSENPILCVISNSGDFPFVAADPETHLLKKKAFSSR